MSVRLCTICERRQADRRRELCSLCYLAAPAAVKAADDWIRRAGVIDDERPAELCDELDALAALPAYTGPRRWAA